ncbi:MAG: hypothetical protein HY709_01215, partial [Candidatus Latescibacteria bacterium]|nr:hypothetical protein [Candidatus Latescibacterota bacterium]
EYERLSDMEVPMVKLPTTQTWGRRSFWFRDPDGNIVNFYANVKGERSMMKTKEIVCSYFHRLLVVEDMEDI